MKKNKALIVGNKKDVLQKFVLLVLSVFGVFGVMKTFEIILGSGVLNNTFIPVVLFLLEVILYMTKVKKHKRSETIFEVLFSVFVAVIMVMGAELDVLSEILWNIGTFVKVVCFAIFTFPFLNVAMSFIQRVDAKNIELKNEKKLFFITYIVVFLGGVLVWLATFPGIWGYDAATQFATILNVDEDYTKSVGAHYSLPLGWLMTTIMSIGNNMFGSFQAGLALCCFLQLIFMSYVATRIILYATKMTKNIYVYIIAVAFFALFPLYTSMTIYMTQDTIFGGLFALTFINLCELAFNKGYWDKKRNPIFLSILLLLVCLSRNNGFYCLLIAFVILIFFVKKKRMATIAVFAIPMCLFQIYNGPILNAFSVDKSSAISEILSVPSQQIARVYNYNSDVIDENNKKAIDKYYANYKDFVEYVQYPSIADFSKRYINRENVTGDFGGYVGLWLELGIKDPKNYIEAAFLNNIGFWYPNKNYPDSRMGIPYFEYDMTDRGDDRFLVIERESQIPIYDKALESVLVENSFVKMPVFSSLCSMGTYFILFCFLIGFSIAKKQWKNFIPISIVVGLYVTLLLSPIAVYRYCFPIIILWPIFIGMIFAKGSGQHR